uniref:Zinc finger CCCH domain-containing protein 6 n=1 Tax=Cajanus cajan TaxID=3821 RepID=A0A151RBF3_CAJCA|nr:Zinc finger CCCH domain-containing protein 6 [Cajanus cajan]
MLHSSMSEPNDLPPGFESSHFRNQSKVELSCIAQTKWECPAPFVVSSHWRVAAGEESREKEDQKLREMRVLEAVYPRLSAIPPSPTVSLNVEEEDYDDNITPLIPIIPIEEEESMDILPEFSVEVNPSPNVQLQNSQQYMSATNSITTIMSSNEQGRLIDMDLLVKIFNDPKVIEKLINEHTTATTTLSASSNTVDIPSSVTPPVSMFTPSPAPNMHRSISKNFHHVTSGMSPALNTQSQQDTALASGPKRAASVASISSSSAFAVKDANYYKNLIRQHGADRQDMQDSHIGIRHSKFQDMKPVHNLKQGEVNHKIQKPCIYFKSSRGCRNGSNCPYLHDIPAQWGAGNVLGAQSAKRLKLGSEI